MVCDEKKVDAALYLVRMLVALSLVRSCADEVMCPLVVVSFGCCRMVC